MNRRDVLSVSVVGLFGVVGGCLGTTETESMADAADSADSTDSTDSEHQPSAESPPNTGSASPEGGPRTTEACDGSSSESGAGGAAPPWAVVGHPADIVVSHESKTAPTVLVRLGETQKRVDLTAEGSHWLSGDVIPNGTAATITVETASGLTTTVDWEPEQHNRQYVSFVVTADRIRSRVHTKRCDSDME